MINLRVGARPSPLAVRQAEEVESLLPSARFEIVKIETEGDKDKATPLSNAARDDFFTREIEDALLSGRIDAAIHSAKDLEGRTRDGLVIAAVTTSISRYECLVSRRGETLKDLPPGAVIGTSSQKRKESVLRVRRDLRVKDIRGDIGQRIGQLDRGNFDAIIVAHAALIRLGLEERISEIIPKDIIEPHPLQGRLAIQIRKDRTELLRLFEVIDEDYKR